MKRFCVSRATIEYGHCYVDAETEEEAITKAKEQAEFSFDEYSGDGELEELTKGEDGKPRVTEYDVVGEEEIRDE